MRDSLGTVAGRDARFGCARRGWRSWRAGFAVLAGMTCAALVLLGAPPSWAVQAGGSHVIRMSTGAGSGAGSSCCTVKVNGPSVTMSVTHRGTSATRTFTGKAGQSVSEVLTGLKTSDDGCATLTLTGPGHAAVDQNSGCGNGTAIGVGPDVLPTSGTYTVLLTVDTNATGGGTLWVSAPVTIGTATVNGPAEPLKVTRYGQGVARTFQGKAGQSVSEVLTGLTTSDDGCATLTLTGPGHAAVDQNSGCGNGTAIGVGPDVLPTSGTYTVLLTVDTNATGGGTLWVSAPVTIGTATVNGPAEPLKVTRYGQGVARTFQGKAGQSVSEVLTGLTTSDDGCATLTLTGPGHAAVDQNSGCGNGTAIGVGPDTLHSTGTYTVLLTVDTNATGGGTLWVSAPVTIGTATVNGPAEPLKVTRYGQGVARTFQGKAGQSVSEVLTGLTTSDDGCATLTLTGPGHAAIGQNSGCGNGTAIGVGPDTLPTSGTYTVLLTVDTNATGGGTLKVST